MKLELDLRNREKIIPKIASDHYELKIEDYDIDVVIKFDYHEFDQLADDFRNLSGEKTYSMLEEENIFLKAEKEELENEIEVLKETNEMLRRL